MEDWLITTMAEEGFQPGEPNQLDADACASRCCLLCGCLGLEYRPFASKTGYKCLAECPECGCVLEISSP